MRWNNVGIYPQRMKGDEIMCNIFVQEERRRNDVGIYLYRRK